MSFQNHLQVEKTSITTPDTHSLKNVYELKYHQPLSDVSTYTWICLMYTNLQFKCVCIQSDTKTQNVWLTVPYFSTSTYKYTDVNTEYQNYVRDILQSWTWELRWLSDLATFKCEPQYRPNWFKSLRYLYAIIYRVIEKDGRDLKPL